MVRRYRLRLQRNKERRWNLQIICDQKIDNSIINPFGHRSTRQHRLASRSQIIGQCAVELNRFATSVKLVGWRQLTVPCRSNRNTQPMQMLPCFEDATAKGKRLWQNKNKSLIMIEAANPLLIYFRTSKSNRISKFQFQIFGCLDVLLKLSNIFNIYQRPS